MCMYVCMCVHMHMCAHMCAHVYVCIIKSIEGSHVFILSGRMEGKISISNSKLY